MSSGDGTDLAAAVVAALLQAATGAAGAAGTPFGADGVGWVQEGLRQLPRWAQAAERADSAPQDDGARLGLAEAVGELLSLHPALAESLETRRAERAAQPVEEPPAPTTVTVGASAVVGGAGQTALGTGNVLVGGNIHNKVVNKHGNTGLLIAVLVVVGALVALGIHFLGGSKNLGSAPRLPASVEGEQRRASSDSDWEKFRASLTRDGVESPQTAAYGSVPNSSTDLVLAGDDHTARWEVVIANVTMTFQRTFAESMAGSKGSSGGEVPTSLPGKMYCSATSHVVSEGDDLGCIWFDDTYVIIVNGVGRDPKIAAAVIERIYHGTEH
ncbi:hypothetical protein [Kitasatospora sp. NPDC097691]|uniref:hypothetical protein n=1 Tax=Kitasatospora sp. NPDC097691 TaxID=3157231 RepID=UPI0033194DE3